MKSGGRAFAAQADKETNMYTWEIQSYFEKRNYELSDYFEFHKIFLESPQINSVKLIEIREDRSKYFVNTTDGFSFEFWLKIRE